MPYFHLSRLRAVVAAQDANIGSEGNTYYFDLSSILKGKKIV